MKNKQTTQKEEKVIFSNLFLIMLLILMIGTLAKADPQIILNASPNNPEINATLICNVTVIDPDYINGTLEYYWYLNSQPTNYTASISIVNNTSTDNLIILSLNDSITKVNDTWSCYINYVANLTTYSFLSNSLNVIGFPNYTIVNDTSGNYTTTLDNTTDQITVNTTSQVNTTNNNQITINNTNQTNTIIQNNNSNHTENKLREFKNKAKINLDLTEGISTQTYDNNNGEALSFQGNSNVTYYGNYFTYDFKIDNNLFDFTKNSAGDLTVYPYTNFVLDNGIPITPTINLEKLDNANDAISLTTDIEPTNDSGVINLKNSKTFRTKNRRNFVVITNEKPKTLKEIPIGKNYFRLEVGNLPDLAKGEFKVGFTITVNSLNYTYYLDPSFLMANLTFNNGNFMNTTLNRSDGSVILNLTFNTQNTTGGFISQIIDSAVNQLTVWNNISWISETNFSQALPDNGKVESRPYILNTTNMTGNILLLHLDNLIGSTNFNDTSGFINNGSCPAPNCSYANLGIYNNSATFNGTTYIDVNWGNRLNLTSYNLTVAAWVKASKSSNNDTIQPIVSQWNYSNFTGASLYTGFNIASVNTSLKGFRGGGFDGRYMYLTISSNPGAPSNGMIARYDTYASFTGASSWNWTDLGSYNSTVGGTNLTKCFNGAVFDGRYMYFIPNSAAAGCGMNFVRYDTTKQWNDTVLADGVYKTFNISIINTSLAPTKLINTTEGGVFDGRYVYWNPNGNGQIIRYDTTADFQTITSYSNFNVSSMNRTSGSAVGLLVGFSGGTFDGRYIYWPEGRDIVARINDEVVQYDTTASFTAAASYKNFNIQSLNTTAFGNYEGAVFDGRYVYFVPGNSRTTNNSMVARYDTTQSFTTAASWTTFNVSSAGTPATAIQYKGAVFDGKYVYLIPGWNDVAGAIYYNPVMARYDTTQSFTAGASWQFVNNSYPNRLQTRAFNGAVFDGRYMYLIPYYQGSFHGNMVRYDTTGNNATFFLGYYQGNNGGYGSGSGVSGPRFMVNTNNSNNSVYNTLYNANITNNTWTLLVATFNQTNITLYLNGSPVDTMFANASLFSMYPNNITIGMMADNTTTKFNGSIDEVAIWNRTLNSTEVLTLYKRGILRLNLTTRSCALSDCSDYPFSNYSTFSHLILDTSTGLKANRYFQFQLNLTTNDTLYSPNLMNATINYTVTPIIPTISTNFTNNSIYLNYSNVTQFWFIPICYADACGNFTVRVYNQSDGILYRTILNNSLVVNNTLNYFSFDSARTKSDYLFNGTLCDNLDNCTNMTSYYYFNNATVDGCGVFTTPNMTNVTLTQNIMASNNLAAMNGACFNFTATNVSLSCSNMTGGGSGSLNITGNYTNSSFGIWSNANYTNVTNCTIGAFGNDIYLNGSNNSIFVNDTLLSYNFSAINATNSFFNVVQSSNINGTFNGTNGIYYAFSNNTAVYNTNVTTLKNAFTFIESPNLNFSNNFGNVTGTAAGTYSVLNVTGSTQINNSITNVSLYGNGFSTATTYAMSVNGSNYNITGNIINDTSTLGAALETSFDYLYGNVTIYNNTINSANVSFDYGTPMLRTTYNISLNTLIATGAGNGGGNLFAQSHFLNATVFNNTFIDYGSGISSTIIYSAFYVVGAVNNSNISFNNFSSMVGTNTQANRGHYALNIVGTGNNVTISNNWGFTKNDNYTFFVNGNNYNLTGNNLTAINGSAIFIKGINTSIANESYSSNLTYPFNLTVQPAFDANLSYSNVTNVTVFANETVGIRVSGSNNTFIGGSVPTSWKAIYISNISSWWNTFTNMSLNSSNTTIHFEINVANQSVYYNNITGTNKFINNSNLSNQFNTTLSSGAAAGNNYSDILNLHIADSNANFYGDTGDQYPYNATYTNNWTGVGADWGPFTSNQSVSKYVAFTMNANLTTAGINFGNLTLNTIHNNATNNSPSGFTGASGTAYAITISADTNTNTVALCINGTSNLVSAGNNLPISNLFYNVTATNTAVPNATSKSLAGSAFSAISPDVTGLSANAIEYFNFWLTVPSTQGAGTYTGKAYIQATSDGGACT